MTVLPADPDTRSSRVASREARTAWRLLRTPPASAAWNMACDHLLAETAGRRGGSPVLRLYGWRPPAISVGYNQPLRDVTDRLPELARLGIDVIRRPTGGAAVFHAAEVTYAVADRGGPLLANGARAACARIHAAIRAGLESLGIADLSLHEPSGGSIGVGLSSPASRPAGNSAGACFGAASRSEVAWRGLKLVGSAQRRLAGALLQHGSILLDGDQGPLEILWPGSAEVGCGTLTAAGTRARGVGETAAAVIRGFELEFGASFYEDDLQARELRRIRELEADLYGSRVFLLRV